MRISASYGSEKVTSLWQVTGELNAEIAMLIEAIQRSPDGFGVRDA